MIYISFLTDSSCLYTRVSQPFLLEGQTGCQEIDGHMYTILVFPDTIFVAACLDQCPVGLVPFRKSWTSTLELRMDNDVVGLCLVWYMIYSNGA